MISVICIKDKLVLYGRLMLKRRTSWPPGLARKNLSDWFCNPFAILPRKPSLSLWLAQLSKLLPPDTYVSLSTILSQLSAIYIVCYSSAIYIYWLRLLACLLYLLTTSTSMPTTPAIYVYVYCPLPTGNLSASAHAFSGADSWFVLEENFNTCLVQVYDYDLTRRSKYAWRKIFQVLPWMAEIALSLWRFLNANTWSN